MMHNTSKILESSYLQKNGLQNEKQVNSIDEIKRGTDNSFISPKITSGSRRDFLFSTPQKPHILSPRRYSLSDITTPPRITRRDSIKSPHLNSGPLLTSTQFSINVSTYEETKSPGLVGRIVQYNEEAERERKHVRPPTHQAKYGSPGLFPVVHLFKKQLPTLETPKRITVRIASPEYLRHHSLEYNRKLLEGIVKPSSPSSIGQNYSLANGEPSTSTRSVLDALKEISRKRIHANEEYELEDDCGKRQKTDLVNGADSNKRLRDDSPLLDNLISPNKQHSKRVCMYDEYAASCSSTDYSNKSNLSRSKRKSVSTSTITDSPKESKQVKLINVETQTPSEEPKKPIEDENLMSDKNTSNDVNSDTPKPVKQQENVLKIFDDAPLERIRKNRLAALMGSLTGKELILTPKPTMSSILNGDTENSASPEFANDSAIENKSVERPLVSILSTSKKSPQKPDKHVTFSVPESTSQISVSTSTMTKSILFTSAETTRESTISNSTATLETPSTKLATPAPPSSPVNLQSNSVDLTIVPGSEKNGPSNTLSANSVDLPSEPPKIDFQFGPQNRVPSVSFPPVSTSTTVTTTSQFSFIPSSTSQDPVATSPSKAGGFKFNLGKPSSNSPKNSICSIPVENAKPISIPSFQFGSSQKPEKGEIKSNTEPGPLFNSKTTSISSSSSSTTLISTGLTFGTTTTTSSSGAPITSSSAAPSFQFASLTQEAGSKATGGGFNFGASPSSFGSSTSTAATNVSAFGAATNTLPLNPAFSFGSSNPKTNTPVSSITTSTFTFGPKTVSTASPSSSFGTSTTTTFKLPTTSSGFGSAISNFGAPNTVSSDFGTPSNAFGSTNMTIVSSAGLTGSKSVFGKTVTSPSSFGIATTTSGAFNIPATGEFGAVTALGNNKALPSFGAATTTTSSFGNSASSPFSSSNNSMVTSPLFGATNTASSFGTADSFNNTTTASSIFGPTNVVAATVGFGVSGNTSNNIFGGTTVTQTGNFGAPNSGSIFVTTQSAAPFGNVTTPSATPFGYVTTPSATPFGNVTTQSATPFGNVTTPSATPFGNVTTQSAPPFGNVTTTSVPSFGSSNTPVFSFGANTTTNNKFGSNAFSATTDSNNVFGSASTPSFASPNSFGTATIRSSNTFGSSTTANFGTRTTQPTGFSNTNTPSFSTSNQGFGATKSSIFGATTTTANFGTNASLTPAFGTNSAPPAFGVTTPAPSFGSASNTSSFGAGSAFSKPQPAGFGATSNMFGSNTGFGSGQPQANTGFAVPSIATTTQSSGFNFGGSSTSKPAVFSFGGASSGDPPKPKFNFTGGNSAPNFGAAGSPFGSTATPSFTGASTPQFGAPNAAVPGMFNIGTGSPRTRTPSKPKRRN